MSMEWDEIRHRWAHAEPVEGIAFLVHDCAVVTGGPHRGAIANVLALRAVHPQPEFEVELFGRGERLVLPQSELASQVPETIADSIAWIQKWYAKQCDGDWEHQNGFSITTLDNPGWSVTVDLAVRGESHYSHADLARKMFTIERCSSRDKGRTGDQ